MALSANVDYKLVSSGGYDKVQELVANDTIKPGCIVINEVPNSQSRKMYLIDDEKNIIDVASDEYIFSSYALANAYVTTTGTDAKAGRIISVNENNDVKLYVVVDEEGNGNLSLKEYAAGEVTVTGPVWEEL